MLLVRPYVPEDAANWDALVARSRNGNLLHRRGYMDYHEDRFIDASLVVEKAGEMVGVFPASAHDDGIVSHGGLTYAGLISTAALRAEAMLDAFAAIGTHYRGRGVSRILYKAVPRVFQSGHADEDLYALHRLGARLVRRDLSSAIALREPFAFSQGRRHDIGKARKAGIDVAAGDDLAGFHALLTDALHRHDASPTHRLDELQRLCSRFPEAIALHEARRDGELLAGVLVYDFGRVVHTQYMAASEQGRALGALSLTLEHLIRDTYADRQHFSFGISTEQGGQVLNTGLVAQKESFGARAVVHDFYEWTP